MSGLAERLRPSTSVKDWGKVPAAPAYVRPADWLALPVVNVGDQKFVGLHAVWNHESNFCAVNCAGAYTVDWGDGSAPVNVATGASAYKNYVYTDLSSGTLSTRGYRQAIVTITPQAGQNLTKVDLYRQHNQSGLVAGYTSGWLDIRMAGSLVTNLIISTTSPSTVFHRMLEQFEYVGTNGVTSFADKFNACSSLRSILALYTGAGTDFSAMFTNCRALQTIPLLNTAAGTSFTNMFGTCRALQTIPLLNTAAGLDFSSMFNGCQSLQTVPQLNTAAGTNFSSMFGTCQSLQTVPLLNTGAGTNFTSMFNGCTALQTVPLLNTGAGTSFTSMFNTCTALQTIPLLNTAAGTTFSNMFLGCTALQSVPLLNTAAGTGFASMFQNCAILQSVPAFNTGAGTTFTSMFNGCSSLEVVPALNVAAGTTFATMFTGCPSLRSAPLAGTAADISYASCSLGPAALDAIYAGLATFTNMLSRNAASVETSVADWNVAPVNCAVTQLGVGGGDGAAAVGLSSTASGVASVAITTRVSVSASTQYTFLASMKAGNGNRNFTVAVAWYTAGGALISTDTSGSLTGNVATYTQNAVTATSPATAATASLILSFTATIVGDSAYFDKMGLFPGTVSTWTPGGPATITVTSNWGTTADTPSTATAKGWSVTGS